MRTALVVSLMGLAVVGGGCQRDERAAQESGYPVTEVAPVLWTIRYPPLHEYDPQLSPNVQNVRLGAPLALWIVADERRYKSATDCEQAKTEQYVREYGRRTTSIRLYLDAVGHAADAQVLAVLHRRAARDSGHLSELSMIHSSTGPSNKPMNPPPMQPLTRSA